MHRSELDFYFALLLATSKGYILEVWQWQLLTTATSIADK